MSGIEVLLDTNIIIGILKSYPETVKLVGEKSLDISVCAASQITRMELLSFPGISPDEENAISDFLSNIEVLPVSFSVEQKTIEFRKLFGGKLPDAIIAATAKEHELDLLTLDKTLLKNFARF